MSEEAELEKLKAELLKFAQDWLADRGWDRGLEVRWMPKREGLKANSLILGYSEAMLLKFQIARRDASGHRYSVIEVSETEGVLGIDNQKTETRIEFLNKKLGETLNRVGIPVQEEDSAWRFFRKKNIAPISQVNIHHFYAIEDINLADLNASQEIYFLGENGDGKTLLLQAFHLTFAMQDIMLFSHDAASAAALQLANGKNGGSLKGQDGNGKNHEANDSPDYVLNHFFAYGPNRSLFDSDEYDPTGFMSLYTHDTKLFSPERLLEFAKNGDVMRQANVTGIRTIGAIPLDEIKHFFEVLLEDNVRIEMTDRGEWRFHEKGFALPFRQLSEGYKNLLIWVSDLLYRFQTAEPTTTKIVDFQGVVILDEVELHLHPRWQATLVPKLRKHFPKVQWFFSTHSPAVVTGAGEDAVFYRVYRDQTSGKSHVSEPYHKRNMTHMMFNTLMTSPLFGLDSARISPDTDSPDTNDSFVSSRVAHAVEERLEQQRKEGKAFISESEIDAIIAEVLDDELKG